MRISQKIDSQRRWVEIVRRARRSIWKFKHAVTSTPVLRYFHSSLLVKGQGDASSSGIGFVMMQKGEPGRAWGRRGTTGGKKKKVVSGSWKMAGCGSEMRNATHLYLVCIRLPEEQEREMIFDLHQCLLGNQGNKTSRLVWKTMDVSRLYTNIPQEERTDYYERHTIRFITITHRSQHASLEKCLFSS